MNELQIFNNEEFGQVRTIQINNEPWFVGKDIAEILGYENPQKAIRDHVDGEDIKMGERNVTPSIIDSLGREQFPSLINESGLYALIFGSKLETAKKFKHWVTSEVIPQIRKTGGYKLPSTYAEALENLLLTVKENERLVNENETFKAEREVLLPKADFFDAVAGSKDSVPVGDVAKILDMGIGRNKLFEFLRDEKILDYCNRPYQKYIDQGYFRVVEQKYEKNGEICINIKTLVYQKGINFIRKKLEKCHE